MKELKDYTEEEVLHALKNMQNKAPSELDENTYHLFEAIMKIADERDEYKRRISKTLSLVQEKEANLKKTITVIAGFILQDYEITLNDIEKMLKGKKQV